VGIDSAPTRRNERAPYVPPAADDKLITIPEVVITAPRAHMLRPMIAYDETKGVDRRQSFEDRRRGERDRRVRRENLGGGSHAGGEAACSARTNTEFGRPADTGATPRSARSTSSTKPDTSAHARRGHRSTSSFHRSLRRVGLPNTEEGESIQGLERKRGRQYEWKEKEAELRSASMKREREDKGKRRTSRPHEVRLTHRAPESGKTAQNSSLPRVFGCPLARDRLGTRAREFPFRSAERARRASSSIDT